MIFKLLKKWFLNVFWFLASFFGYVRVWRYSTHVGAWSGGQREPFSWPFVIRVKRRKYGMSRIIIPSTDNDELQRWYHNANSLSIKDRVSGGTVRGEFECYRLVKGDAMMFYFGRQKNEGTHSALVIVYTGWRWKTLVPPPIVTSFGISSDHHGTEAGSIRFRHSADFEWNTTTMGGINHKVMLDYLSGRITYGELQAAWQIFLLERREYYEAQLKQAIDYLDRTKDAFRSPLVKNARLCIERAMNYSQN